MVCVSHMPRHLRMLGKANRPQHKDRGSRAHLLLFFFFQSESRPRLQAYLAHRPTHSTHTTRAIPVEGGSLSSSKQQGPASQLVPRRPQAYKCVHLPSLSTEDKFLQHPWKLSVLHCSYAVALGSKQALCQTFDHQRAYLPIQATHRPICCSTIVTSTERLQPVIFIHVLPPRRCQGNIVPCQTL